MRGFVFWTLFYVWTFIVGTPAVVMFAGPYHWVGWVPRAWCHGTLFLCRTLYGLRYEVEGAIPEGAVIIAPKHQSAMETFLFHLLVPRPLYVLKKELMKLPVVGSCFRRLGQIPVDRSAGLKALRHMADAAQDRLKNGPGQVIIFPEGTRVTPGEKQGYLPGVAYLYGALNLPVVPVALNTGLFWPRGGAPQKGGVATLRILEPIQPGLDRKAFMAILEERIETACDDLLPTDHPAKENTP